ncbi:hypothetical protein AVEN_194831-1 [Araneus ventricosus]|uniref:Tc1-like transposase DDE domain-containing protein n=1 Tax=Araneus ventricosus TaxID=182803 RepID=A0A4Y2B5K2_ARAVE|nr:hypothetical protein AVEN_194831-1 [Araneus ventricosus]
MQKRSDLSDVQKGMIIGFRAKGGSIPETANFVNCSRAAVVKVYRAWQYGTIQNQRRGTCGAPRAIDDRGERRLRRCVRANRRATVEQLTAQMNQGATKSVSSSSVLADHVHSYMRIIFPQNDGIYQQDNARCHTARNVCAWFEEHQDEFTVLPWPANSPDLNPIENLWDYLDRVVRAMDPQPRNLAQLATALESAWLNIPVNTFRNLIDSLPARLAAVRSAKGGYSGF